MSVPSLCIPHLLNYVTEDKVRRVFNDLFECECVKEVKFIHVGKDGKEYNVCFIHFHEMPVNPDIGKWQLDPADPGAFFRLVPDPHKTNKDGVPYFWKVFLNKKAKPVIQ